MDAAANNELWEVIEVFGHQQIAGRVTEVQRFGETLCQVEVPEVDGKPGFTRRFSGKAIFSETPVTKEIVIDLLRRGRIYVANPLLLTAPAETPPDAEEVGPRDDRPAVCVDCDNVTCTCDDVVVEDDDGEPA